MNKNDLINALSAKIGGTKKVASDFLNAFCEVISESLTKEEEVKILGFGNFKTAQVSAKIITNPQTKMKMEVKAYKRVRFIPGKKLKEEVNS